MQYAAGKSDNTLGGKDVKKRLTFIFTLVICVVISGCSGAKEEKSGDDSIKQEVKEDNIEVRDLSGATEEEAWEYAEEIIAEIKQNAPVFGDYEVSIEDFGAKKSDTELEYLSQRELAISNTKAIYKAICDVNSQKEGGIVNVPPGTWYTSAIHLLSNVNFHLEEGAVLKFAPDTDLYAGDLMKELYGSELTFTRSGGIEMYNYSPFIYAYQADNIALTGTGTIDGQAGAERWTAWRTLGEPAANDNLLKQAATGVDVKERKYGESDGQPGVAIDGYIRPNFVEFVDCDNVLIEDITTANSPCWQLHPVYCNYVTVRRVNINSLNANNDGCNPDSCKYVLIEENTFNTGDDCIAIKSGKNEDGRRVNIACENIVIQNNVMQEGHGGITLGSEASAGIRNVFARNNRMESLAEECALRFKNSPLRGNVLENIYYKDTTVTAFKSTRDMIVFESDYGYETEKEYLEGEKVEIKEYPPITRNVYIDGFYAVSEKDVNNICETAIIMEGTDKSPVSDIHLSNFNVEKANQFMNLKYVDGLTLDNATITRNRKADKFESCKNISFSNVSYLKSKISQESDFSSIDNFKSENVAFNKE